MKSLGHVLVYLTVMIGAGIILFYSPFSGRAYTGESGPYEIGQLAAVILAAALWLWPGNWNAHWSVRIFFGNLFLAFAGREAGWLGEYGASEQTETLLKSTHIVVFAAILVAVIAFWITQNARDQKVFRNFAGSGAFQFVVLCAIMLNLGEAFEKGLLGVPQSVFWEEWSELVAFVALIVARLRPAKSGA